MVYHGDAYDCGTGMMDTPNLDTLYGQIGVMTTVEHLAAAFYRRVAADPRLRPLFPDDLQPAIQHLALFLAQRVGGPTTYAQQRGHPRLRLRHRPFRIGRAERDAWVGHMVAAMDEVGMPAPARTLLHTYFADTGTFLINTTDDRRGLLLVPSGGGTSQNPG